MARYGYMLLDKMDPDVGRQAMLLDAIGGFDRIFVDRHFQEPFEREQRIRLLEQLQPDDVVYAAAADRFCDHLRDFLNCQNQIAAAGGEIVLLEENLDSRSPAGRQTIRALQSFDILGYSWQSARKKAGIQQARQAGRRIGRPPVAVPPGFREICREWAAGRINGQEASRRSGLRSTSFYKKAAEFGFQAPQNKSGK